VVVRASGEREEDMRARAAAREAGVGGGALSMVG